MSLSCEIIRGKPEPLGGTYRIKHVLVTGASLTVSIRRSSDGLKLDFADMAFKVTPGTPTHALTETPAASGRYIYVFNTGAISNAVSAGVDEVYDYDILDVTNGYAIADLSGEIRVCAIDAAATSAAAAASSAATAVTQTAAAAINAAAWGTGSRTITGTTTDAIDASSVSAAAVAKIQSGLATSSALSTAQTGITAIMGTGFTSGTDDLHSAHTLLAGAATGAALTSAANSIKGASFTAGDDLHSMRAAVAAIPTTAAPSASEVVSALWSTDLPGAFPPGSAGNLVGNHLDVAVGTRLDASAYSAPPTASAIAAQVDTTLTSAHGAGAWGSAGGLTLQQIVDGVWNELFAAHSTANSFASLLRTNLDAAVSTRLASASYAAGPDAATITSAVWAAGSRTLTGVAGLGVATQAGVDALAAAVAALPAPLTGPQTAAAVWGALVASYAGVGAFGALLGGNLDVAVSSRSTLGAGAAMTLTAGAITAIQAGLATAVAVAAIPTTPAPTAQQVSTQVLTDLATAHGAGPWTATDVSALATTSQINAAQASLATAISGVPAAVGALAIGSATDPLTLAGALTAVRRLTTWTPATPNKKVFNTITSRLDVYGDDGVTVLYSIPLHDTTGGIVTASPGDPWQVG